jgi:hypothetical protein
MVAARAAGVVLLLRGEAVEACAAAADGVPPRNLIALSQTMKAQ